MEHEELITAISDAVSDRKHLAHINGKHEGGQSVTSVLFYLLRRNEPVNPKELKEHLDVSTPRITAILNDMEQKGLINRTPAAEDKRRILVTLTEKGKQSVAQRKREQRLEISALLEIVGDADGEALLRVLAAAGREENSAKEID